MFYTIHFDENWQKLWTHVHKYDLRDIFDLQPREGDISF